MIDAVLKDKLERLVREAMTTLRRGGLSSDVVGIGAGGDLTKSFDKVIEDMLVNGIREIFNDEVLIVTEELGVRSFSGEPKWLVIMDPVDGSTNYDAGIPWVSISLAVAPLKSSNVRVNDIELAMVGDVFGDKIYTYLRGRVKVNGKDIRRLKRPKNVLLGYFESPDAYSIVPKYFRIRGRKAALRSLGSIALEIVYVGLGRAELLTDLRAKVRNLDVAAAYRIAEALGAKGVMCGKEPLSNLIINKLVRVPCLIVAYDSEVLFRALKALESRA